MSALVEFVKPTPALLSSIACNMREADRVEIWASHNQTPENSVFEGVEISDYVSIALINGEPAALFGLVITNILASTGVPWLLGTNLMDDHKRVIVRYAHILTQQMNSKCHNLVNYVHTKNRKSIRLLKAVGFTVDDAAPYGVEGELFHMFHRENEDV